MKKLILSLAFAGTIMVASTACNSTKNASDSRDSVLTDTTMTPMDTTGGVTDTTMTMPPDTTQM